ncbi:MAG: RNA polymerase sigma factor [Bacteroidota bacterium]
MKKQKESTIYKARDGDRKAYQELVEFWHPRIYNFAYKYFSSNSRRGVPHDLAMEVSQKTFISVHRNLGKLQDTKRFKGWLYRIALNYCYEEDRRNQRKPIFSFQELGKHQEVSLRDSYVERSTSPYASVRKQNCKEWIYKALEQIPKEQRTVVIMKEFEGLKFKEIAQSLEISENTAKSRMYYGLHALRKIFEAWDLDKESMLYE